MELGAEVIQKAAVAGLKTAHLPKNVLAFKHPYHF
jgi:hypothetical protein